MRIGHSRRTAIGVDIGRRTIKAAQLLVSDGKPRACALSSLPRPEPEEEVSGIDALALREVLNRQGFSGNRIAMAVPEKALLRASLELPSSVAGAPVKQIIRMELARLHSVAPDSFTMACWELKGAAHCKPVTHALALGCPHDAANALLDSFEAAGFRVVALDTRGAAAARACAPLILPAPQITAIVDLGWRSTSVLFVCGQSLIYERSLEGASIAELTDRLTEAFGIPLESAYHIIGTIGPASDEGTKDFDRETLDAIRKHLRSHFDKLFDELRVSLSYANHHFPTEGVKRLLLIGGGAGVPQLARYFEGQSNLEVKAAEPRSLIESPPELLAKAVNPAMTVAIGLAQFDGD